MSFSDEYQTESNSIQKRDSSRQRLGFDPDQATQHYESENNNEVFRNIYFSQGRCKGVTDIVD